MSNSNIIVTIMKDQEPLINNLDTQPQLQSQQTHPYTYLEQLLLLLIGMLSWTAWPYCFDIPQGVQTQLKQPPYNLTIPQFNHLYVLSSLPNALLNFVSGWITMKLGPVKSIFIYSSLLLIAQSSIYLATWKVFSGWYPLLLAGRFLLGFAGYAMTSANLSIIPRYTDKKLVALFVGIGSMLPWTAEALCDLITPIIYHHTHQVSSSFFAGWIMSLISFLFSIILFLYTRYLDVRRESTSETTASVFKLKQIKKLGVIMIIIFFTLFFAVSIEGSIIINANDMLHERVGFSNTQAGTIAMMTLLTNGPVTPLWAFIKQKIIKKRRLFPIIGIVLLADILILYFLPERVSPLSYAMAYIGFILLGVWDSGAVTVIIGSFPLILEESILPLGFSIYTSSLALGMGLSPMVVAAIIERSANYKQGYKNTYYLYFGYFVMAFSGLLYLWLGKDAQAAKIETLPPSESKESIISQY